MIYGQGKNKKNTTTMQEINSQLSKEFVVWLCVSMNKNNLVFSELNEYARLGQRICSVFSNIKEIHEALDKSVPELNEQNFLYNLWIKSVRTSEGFKKALANNPDYQKMRNN